MHDASEPRGRAVEVVRRALIDAALAAYDDAGLSGLCVEGRWEAAVDAMRRLDLARGGLRTTERDARFARMVEAVLSASTPPPNDDSVAITVEALATALAPIVMELTPDRPD